METTIIAISFMTFFIGFAVGRPGRKQPDTFDSWYEERAKRAESQLSYERTLSTSLRQQIDYINRNCRYHHERGFCAHVYNQMPCEPKVYMPSIKEQELVDLINKSQKNAKQLAKDLQLPLTGETRV